MAERRITIVTIADFKNEELTAVDVTATAGDQRFDFILTEPAHQVQFVINEPEGSGVLPVQFRYRAHLRTQGPYAQHSSFESPVITSDASTFIVIPRTLYKWVFRQASAVFDYERYRHVFVDVRAEADGGWSHTETVRIGPESEFGHIRFLVEATAKVSLQRRYRYVTRAGDVMELSWEPAGEGALAVGNPPAAGAVTG